MTIASVEPARKTARMARRGGAFAGFIVFLLGCAALNLVFWQTILDTRVEIAGRGQVLQSLQQAADRIGTNRAPGATGEPAATPYLTGETETLAAAQLQQIVVHAVEATGARLSSIQVRSHIDDQPQVSEAPATAGEAGRQIDVDVVLDATIAETQTVFYGLEQGRPCLFVDAFEVQPVKSAASSGETDDNPQLRVTATLHSYWRS